MKRCSRWVKLLLMVCAVAVLASATHTSTLAFMTDTSNTLRNSFRVEYQPAKDITVPVIINKTIRNTGSRSMDPGGFEFRLVNMETMESCTATTSKEGWAVLNLHFSASDAGKTYHYRLYEVNGGRKYVTYDKTMYDLSITLTLSAAHELSALLEMNGESVPRLLATFENQYCVPAPLPNTGDEAPLLLWALLMLFSGAGLVILRKNKGFFRRP